MPSEAPPAKRRGKRPNLGATDQTSAVAIAHIERRVKALELRKAGKSYPAIAVELGYSDASGAYKAVNEELEKVRREPAVQLLNLQLARLDALLEKAWTLAELGDLDALKECRANVMDAAKLLGLVKQKVDLEVTPPREALWERVRGWLTDPTPELEAAMAEAGWVRAANQAIETTGELLASESGLSE